MKRIPPLLLALALAAPLPGCLLVAGAAVGAGIIYVAGDDSVEVDVESAPEAVFAAAREEVRATGTIDASDPDAGTLSGSVDSSSVHVKVSKVSSGLTKLRVSSRSNAGISPDRDRATEVAGAILRRLR